MVEVTPEAGLYIILDIIILVLGSILLTLAQRVEVHTRAFRITGLVLLTIGLLFGLFLVTAALFAGMFT